MTLESLSLPRLVRKLFLACWVLWNSIQLYAQHSSRILSVQLCDATLMEFTQLIERITDYSFIYNEDIAIGEKIYLNLNDKTLEEVLDGAFAYQPISYKVSGKHIILQRTKPKPKPKPKPKSGSRKRTISGYITDFESQETLIGANVIETCSNNGATTNAYGFYTITLPEGETCIGFSYSGYSPQIHAFALCADTVINVRLYSDNLLEEVLVLSDRLESGLISTHTGALDIPISHVKNTPAIFGEADVMKTIQLMPGVQSGVEGLAGLYIRGGSPDQNLVLLDGTPVYGVDHLMGFFSIFTPEVVKKVALFKGSFPARFGGRLSSVVDVRTNDGDMTTYHGALSIGLFTSRLNVEGPVVKGKTSFNVSLRRSYLDLITQPFVSGDDKARYYFFDINAKVNHKISDKNRVYLSLYHGKDFFGSKFKDNYGDDENPFLGEYDMDFQWGNLIASFRWNSIINNKLFSNTTISCNQYKMAVNAKSDVRCGRFEERYRTNYNSGIHDWSAQTDLDYIPNPGHHVKFGGGYTYHRFKPEVITSRISAADENAKRDSTYSANTNSRINAQELSAYVEDNVDLTSRLRVNVGLHLSYFRVQGKNFFSMQPRLSARYQINKGMTLKTSYSQMNQHINLLTSAPISMPTDIWVPVTRDLKSMLSRQYVLGAYYIGLKGWEFSVEGYYKGMNNILEYKDATRFIGSSASWEEKVEMGKGRSFGVEFMAQRTVGNTTGWINYTLAKSDRKFAKGGINNGERFPYKYDRRHHANLVISHKFNDRVDISGSWFFASGGTTTIAREVTGAIRPFHPTLPTKGGLNVEVIKEEEYVEHRNNFRLPPSHRLNIGVNFHKKTKRSARIWNISFYNIYNAMTPTFVHRSYQPVAVDAEETRETVYRPVLKKITLLPCIPSVTYTCKF